MTDAGLVPALLGLVEPTRRGDPESALCWTTLSTQHLADELTAAGHRVGPDTVAKLLKENGISLQANAKTVEGVTSNHSGGASSGHWGDRPIQLRLSATHVR